MSYKSLSPLRRSASKVKELSCDLTHTRHAHSGLDKGWFIMVKYHTNNNKGEKMTIGNNTYKVGDLFTTQKSKVTGTIKEINPINATNTRVLLDVDGQERWTTVTLA